MSPQIFLSMWSCSVVDVELKSLFTDGVLDSKV